MAKRLVDSVSGIRSVQAGDLILRATRYKLSFWIEDDLPGKSASSGPSMDGHIDISGIGEAAALSGVDQLSLTLADGRTVAFRLKNVTGDIVGV